MKSTGTTTPLREVLDSIVADEAALIDEVCSMLRRAYESHDTSVLPEIITAISQWQNRPPRDILSDLKNQ
jgi:hypothetical protein